MRLLRAITPLLLALCALTGCHSEKTATATAETEERSEQSARRRAHAQRWSLEELISQTEIELRGLTIEYYAPTDTGSRARASPKKVRLETATAKTKTEQKTEEATDSTATSTESEKKQQKKAEASRSATKAEAENPIPWGRILITLTAIGALTYAIKRKG